MSASLHSKKAHMLREKVLSFRGLVRLGCGTIKFEDYREVLGRGP